VLYVGIRNRYCVICERAKNSENSVEEHICFLNWSKGATSIEADAISEGFLKSVSLHGLKFNKLIGKNSKKRVSNIQSIYFFLNLGDGDSSVSKRLHELLPYGPRLLVEKIECRNHILRNYGQKLMALTKKTLYPCYIRKFITRNIIRFRTAITKSIAYRKNLDQSLYEKIEGTINKTFFFFK